MHTQHQVLKTTLQLSEDVSVKARRETGVRLYLCPWFSGLSALCRVSVKTEIFTTLPYHLFFRPFLLKRGQAFGCLVAADFFLIVCNTYQKSASVSKSLIFQIHFIETSGCPILVKHSNTYLIKSSGSFIL